MQIVILMSIMIGCYVLQSLFCKLYSDAYMGEEQSSSAVFSVMFGMVVGIATWVMGGFQMQASSYTWIFGLLMAIMLFLFNASIVNASQLGPYSLIMVANLFGGTIIPVFIAIVFFGETLTAIQALATIIMLLAIFTMNYKGVTLKTIPKKYYIWCIILFVGNGLACSFMNAQQLFMEAKEREQMITIAYVGCATLAFLYHLSLRKKKVFIDYKMGKKSMLFALCSCTVATIAVNLMMIVLSKLDSAVVFTVTNGGILTFSLLCSFLIFKETPSKNQIVGMFLSVIGVILFSL